MHGTTSSGAMRLSNFTEYIALVALKKAFFACSSEHLRDERLRVDYRPIYIDAKIAHFIHAKQMQIFGAWLLSQQSALYINNIIR
jgi:hypothetical protein